MDVKNFFDEHQMAFFFVFLAGFVIILYFVVGIVIKYILKTKSPKANLSKGVQATLAGMGINNPKPKEESPEARDDVRSFKTLTFSMWMIFFSCIALVIFSFWFGWVAVVFSIGIFGLLMSFSWFEKIESPDAGYLFSLAEFKGAVGAGLYFCVSLICEVRKIDRDFVIVKAEDDDVYISSKQTTALKKKADGTTVEAKTKSVTSIGVRTLSIFELGGGDEDLLKNLPLKFEDDEEGRKKRETFLQEIVLSEMRTHLGKKTFIELNEDQRLVEDAIRASIQVKVSQYGWRIIAFELSDFTGSVQAKAEDAKTMEDSRAYGLRKKAKNTKNIGFSQAIAIGASDVAHAFASRIIGKSAKKSKNKEAE